MSTRGVLQPLTTSGTASRMTINVTGATHNTRPAPGRATDGCLRLRLLLLWSVTMSCLRLSAQDLAPRICHHTVALQRSYTHLVLV